MMETDNKLPVVGERVSLNAGGFTDDEPPEGWEAPAPGDAVPDEEDTITDVTVLARDLEEGIWTVWDHGTCSVRMVNFDENQNWAWVKPTPEVTDDQE